MRLDPDVVEALQADGPGWTTRMNMMLRIALGLDYQSAYGEEIYAHMMALGMRVPLTHREKFLLQLRELKKSLTEASSG